MDEKVISVVQQETNILSVDGGVPSTTVPVKEYAVITLSGPQGEDGIDGDKTYVHDQMIASATWTVNHNLNKFPAITIVDSAGEVVEGSIQELTSSQAVLVFSSAFAGKAYCN